MRLYEHSSDVFIFQVSKSHLGRNMTKGSTKANIKRIRVHDLRHSHASHLIHLGFSPLVISERLGHKDIKTTLQTYAHLYPNKDVEVAAKLNEHFKKSKE
jgi:integrase